MGVGAFCFYLVGLVELWVQLLFFFYFYLGEVGVVVKYLGGYVGGHGVLCQINKLLEGANKL